MKRKIFLIAFSCLSLIGFAQKKVVLDNYYNNEFNIKTGKPFHYLWEDKAMSGFSKFGELFIRDGAHISTLKEKPTVSSLKGTDLYIIVDPDTKSETVNPKFMDKIAANVIASWVKKGGVLLMMTNDVNNCELDSFNILAEKFGMHFEKEVLHPEKSEKGKPRNFNSCASVNLPNHVLFKGVSKIFLKEIAPITCVIPAKPVLEENKKVLMAEAKYGKGYVFAVGDPWLYNEYIDHSFLPADFDNFKAAENLLNMLLKK